MVPIGMASQIPRGFIDQLLAQTDLVEIIGSRVKLKKQGKDYYARCPFHTEKARLLRLVLISNSTTVLVVRLMVTL
jgi:hypothetical protein